MMDESTTLTIREPTSFGAQLPLPSLQFGHSIINDSLYVVCQPGRSSCNAKKNIDISRQILELEQGACQKCNIIFTLANFPTLSVFI